MRGDGAGGRRLRSPRPGVIPSEVEVVEFSLRLHVCKTRGRNGKPDLYTIGKWKDTVLESMCLLQPLESALEALGRTLMAADMTQSGSSLVLR